MRNPAGNRDRVLMEIEEVMEERSCRGNVSSADTCKTRWSEILTPTRKGWFVKVHFCTSKTKKKTPIQLMEEKQLLFCSTTELWVEIGRNKTAWQGRRKYQVVTQERHKRRQRDTEDQTKSSKHTEDWRKKERKKDLQMGVRIQGPEIPTCSFSWRFWEIEDFKNFSKAIC